MKRKTFYSIILLFLTICLFTSHAFATNDNSVLKDAADGVKNMVGGAENTVENAARGISNASKNATGHIENTANNMTNDISNSAMSSMNRMTDTNQDNYTATRTSTEVADQNMFGLSTNTWFWLILALAAVGIGILVYSYFAQTTNRNYHNMDE